jgi:hypothetical protein
MGVLLSFVQKGLRQLRSLATDEALTKDVLNILLELRERVPPDRHVMKSTIDDAIDDALDLASVRGMMETTIDRIRGGDRSVQDGSLQLVARRLGAASTTARRETSGHIISVIDFIKDLLCSPPRDDEDRLLRTSALSALVAISATALPDELATLSKTVPVVANHLNSDWGASTGLTAMISLW